MNTIKKVFKGIPTCVIIYIIISGNGDDTFFGFVLLLLSVGLTVLFLDESMNKVSLALITLCLALICAPGYKVAIPYFLICGVCLLLYYVVACKKDSRLFMERIMQFMRIFDNDTFKKDDGGHKKDSYVVWSAFNLLNPFERYFYLKNGSFYIIRGIFPKIVDRSKRIPLSNLVVGNQTRRNIFFISSITVPVNMASRTKMDECVTFSNIFRWKCNELVRILDGRKV